jgi:hypothetical protein
MRRRGITGVEVIDSDWRVRAVSISRDRCEKR